MAGRIAYLSPMGQVLIITVDGNGKMASSVFQVANRTKVLEFLIEQNVSAAQAQKIIEFMNQEQAASLVSAKKGQKSVSQTKTSTATKGTETKGSK